MYVQNPYYYQQSTQIQQLGLKGRPVSSFEEARAMTIDFDGSTFFFPDLANKKIYTKQINMDGTASLFIYELREQPLETAITNTNNFITREEFEQVINELRAASSVPTTPVTPVSAPAATTKLEQGIARMF